MGKESQDLCRDRIVNVGQWCHEEGRADSERGGDRSSWQCPNCVAGSQSGLILVPHPSTIARGHVHYHQWEVSESRWGSMGAPSGVHGHRFPLPWVFRDRGRRRVDARQGGVLRRHGCESIRRAPRRFGVRQSRLTRYVLLSVCHRPDVGRVGRSERHLHRRQDSDHSFCSRFQGTTIARCRRMIRRRVHRHRRGDVRYRRLHPNGASGRDARRRVRGERGRPRRAPIRRFFHNVRGHVKEGRCPRGVPNGRA